MWPLLRFLFWSSAATLALAMLFFWDEWIQPEQPVIGEKETFRSDRPDKADVLSTEDKARAADIDRLSVLLQDLNPSATAPEQPAKAPESKGLFDEMLSKSEASAAKTPSGGDAIENAIAEKDAPNAGEQPLLLPLDDGKPLNVNSTTGGDKSDGEIAASLPSSLPSSGLPSSADMYKAMTGFDYPTTAKSETTAAAAALANPLSAAIQRNQTNSLSSLSAQSESVTNPLAQSPLSPVVPGVMQPTYPSALSWQTQTPGATSFSNPYAAPQFAPTLPGQVSSTNNGGLSGTTSLTPGTAGSANPAGNSYSYLTGGQPDGLGTTAGQGALPSQIGSFSNSGASIYYGSSDSTSLNPAAASPYGRSPYSGASQGTGWTSAPNYGQSPYSGTAPGTGWTSAPPVSPLQPATPSNFGQSSLPSSYPGSSLSVPQGVSPLIPAGTSSYGQVPTPGLNQGSRSNSSGMPQVTVPIVPANYGQSALPGFSQGTGANTPAIPYNYGNTSVQPVQPTQTPNSVPRPIPGRYIGGGQINTFSNP